MSYFHGVKEKDAGGLRQPYFLPGNYVVRVSQVITKMGRGNKPLFIVEAEILESDVPERAAGSSASYIINLQNDMGLVNVKRFVAATQNIALNDKEAMDEIDEQACEFIVGPDQPCAGQVLEVNCYLVDTKAGGKYTVHDWSYVENADSAA